MIRGETIVVQRSTRSEADEYGEPTTEWADESVDDVLVGPPSAQDAADAMQPQAVKASMSLYFPRAYAGGSLRGCRVIVRDVTYQVVGDPIRLDGGITPTKWNMQVDVARMAGAR